MLKKLFVFSALCFTFCTVKAVGVEYPYWDFVEDGIYYAIDSWNGNNNVYVTCREMNSYEWKDITYWSSGDCYEGDVVIPSTVTHDGTTYTVTGIECYAFQSCPRLTSVSIPPTVTYVGYSAFEESENLKAVYISDMKAWLNINFYYEDFVDDWSPAHNLPGGPLNGRDGHYEYNYTCNPLYYAHDLYLNGEQVTSVTYPEDITYVKSIPVYGMTNLRYINLLNTTAPDHDKFTEEFNALPKFVPAGCVQSYKAKGYENVGTGEFSTAMSITGKKSVMQQGETYTFQVTVAPDNAAFKYARWESSDPEVISITTDGTATALTEGTAYIKATTIDTHISDSVLVTVGQPQYSFTVSDRECYVGDTVAISVELNNRFDVAGVQMTVSIPTGFTVALNNNGNPIVELNEGRCTDHVATSKVVDSKSFNVMVYSASADAFLGEDGEVFSIKLVANSKATDGEHTITFSRMVVSDTDGQRYEGADMTSKVTTTSFTPGDVNNDRSINTSDIDLTARYIAGNMVTIVTRAADINTDSRIDIADVSLITRMVKGDNIPTTGLFVDNSANALVTNNYSCITGDTVTVSLGISSIDSITGFQTHISIPAGFTLVNDSFMLSPDLDSDHVIINGSNLVVYSPTGQTLSGDVCTFQLVASPEADSQLYRVTFDNVVMSDVTGVRYAVAPAASIITVTSFMPGDANNDRKVDVADVLLVANKAIGNNPANFAFEAADVNKDKKIDVADVILVANIAIGKDTNAASAPRMGNCTDVVNINDFSINAGEEKSIEVALDNAFAFSALQMTVKLPRGIELKNARLTDRASDEHSLLTHTNENGSVNMLAFAASTENFTGNNGAVLTLTFKANEEMASVDYVELSGILLAECDGNTRSIDNVKASVSTHVTSISDLNAEVGTVNVYSTTGQLVRSNANASNATSHLPAGIYIVGGKKVLVK